MSDYHYRKKMLGADCHECDDGTLTGSYTAVRCDNSDCGFQY